MSRSFAQVVALFVLLPLGVVATEPVAPKAVVVPPKVLTTVQPVHPPELLAAGVDGEVSLLCRVDAQGKVVDVKVRESPHAELSRAATWAVRQWTFEPGTRDGEPGEFQVSIPFRFVLPWYKQLEKTLGRPIFVELEGTPVPAEDMPVWPMPMRVLTAPYPRALAGSGIGGHVILDVIIDHEGYVVNPDVVRSSHDAFVLPAIATALQLKFPPQLGPKGEPVLVNLILQYEFNDAEERARRR
jgi:TonB family protein